MSTVRARNVFSIPVLHYLCIRMHFASDLHLLISIPVETQADAIVHLPNLPHVKRYALDEHKLILRSEMNTASFDDLWGECSLIRGSLG